MKQHFFKIRRIMYSLAITGVMVATTAPVFANDKTENTPVINAQPAVEFVGNDANSSNFHVTFDAGRKTKFELSVLDSDGNVLFKNNYESDKFSKYIKLVNAGDLPSKLYFTISVLPGGKVHKFDVSSNVKTVSDIIVAKQ